MEMPSYHPFKSVEAKEKYLTLYDTRAKKWPIISESKMIDTAYGQTFVRISGPANAQPLVLLHGSPSNSLCWWLNIKTLSEGYRTYAVDNIYDFGRSVYTCAIKNSDDFMCWLNELFNNLELGNNINLIGLSYGGWLASEYALRFPNRLCKIVLLAPAATVLPLRLEMLLRGIPLYIFPCHFYIKNYLSWIYENLVKADRARSDLDGTINELLMSLKCFKPKRMPYPTVLNDKELQSIKVPTLYLIGENDKIYSAQKAVERLDKVAKHIKKEIIPNAGHDLILAQTDLVNGKILEFLNKK